MSRPSFTANACLPETTRACGGEVFVEVNHWPSSTTYMLTAAEAEDWAKRLLAAVANGRWAQGGPDAETTRKQCRRCLKDCAACSCVEDVISRGKGA